MSYQVDSYGNAYFPAGVSVASIPATTGTQNKVLVPGPGGRISSASISQLITQSGGNLVSSVYGRTGAVVARQGDYNTDLVTEGQALYFTDSRARKALSVTTFNTSGPATYDSTTGIINIPQYGSGIVGNYVPVTRTITINGQTADLSANRIFSIDSMVYPSAGIPLSNGTSWGTSIVNNSANWNTAFGWGNHAGLYSLLGHTHTFASLTSIPTTLAGYGITDAATSAQGTKADTAFSWGNHALAGYLTSFTETDPTVASYIKAITTTNIANWNSAYSWGNHALAGYLTSFTETDPIWTSEKINYYTKLQADARYLQSYTETDPVWTSEKANYALKTYVDTSISNLVDSAPGTLDTLNELAAALGDDANFSTTITTLIGTKEPAIAAGTTAQYWRGDKTWQTLPVYTLSGLGGVPTTRTLTINGTSYDLSADRSWSITAGVSSVVGGSGISTSASGGTVTVSNTGILSALAGSGISVSTSGGTLSISNTGLLSGVAGSGISVSTSSGTLSISNTGLLSATAGSGISVSTSGGSLSISNTGILSIVAGSGISVATSSGTTTITNSITNNSQLTNGAGYITSSALSGYATQSWVTSQGYLTSVADVWVNTAGDSMTGNLSFGSSGAGLTWAANTDGASITFESTGDGASGGRALSNLLIALTDNGDEGLKVTTTGAELLYVNINQFQYKGSNVWTAASLTNLNQLTNGPGYITGITSSNVTTALGYTPYNSSNPNGYITGISFANVSAKPTTLSGYGITDSLYQASQSGINVNAFNGTGLYRGSTGDWSNRPTITDNSGALLQIDTHPGNYHTQLFFDSSGSRLYLRSAIAGTWGSWLTMWHSGNLTNLNQLTNGPGYITGYTETDTLATVTSRGNTTNGSINVNGNILLTGSVTTTNQARTIDFTGFDKEGVTDFSDRAYIQHTTNTGGHAGSVLVIASENDADDGIAFLTNASSKLKHNSNNLATESFVTSQGYITSSPLSSYLPLSGGSISGTLTTNGQLAVNDNIVIYGNNKQIQWNAAASADLFISAIPGTRTIEIRNGNAGSPNYAACGLITGYATFTSNVTVQGNITVSSSNTTGGGIILADDGDIVDLNDAYCSMRFSYGVRIYSANRGGSPVITLANTGVVTATTFSGALSGNATTASSISGFNNPTTAANANTIVYRDGSGDVAAREFVLTASTIHVDTPSSMLGIYPTTNQVVKFGSPAVRNFLNVPTRTGGDATGTWAINITGSATDSSTDFLHSNRDFPSGTLVQTSIAYGEFGDPFILEIRGNSYFNQMLIDIQIQGYIYGGTIIATAGLSNGKPISVRAIRVGGNLAFWWPTGGYWEGFNVKVYTAYAGRTVNKVTSITNSAQPTTDKQVDFSLVQSLHSSNYNSYSPTLTGGNASGTWGINITGSAATATDSTKLPLAGGTLTGNLLFSNSGTGKRGIQGTCGDNDFWFIGGGATASNAGFLEIATGDDGQSSAAEPIYVSQYGPGDVLTGTLFRRATLLDANGNTSFPGTVTAPNFTGALSGNATNITAHTINQSVGTGNTPSFAGATLGCGVATGRSGYAPGTLNLVLLSSSGGSDGVCGIDFRSGNNYPSDGASIYYENSQTGSGEVSRLVFRTENDLNDSILMRAGYHVYNARTVDNASQGVENPIFRWQYLDSNRMTLDSSGNLVCNGDITAYSDTRVKTDVKPIENSIEKIQAIRGVTFLRTDAQEKDKEKRHAGVIAQEVLEVLPEVVTENSEGMYSVAYGNLVALLIEGMKEQQTQIEELKNEIKELKNK